MNKWTTFDPLTPDHSESRNSAADMLKDSASTPPDTVTNSGFIDTEDATGLLPIKEC
jgi:hypothetical protein